MSVLARPRGRRVRLPGAHPDLVAVLACAAAGALSLVVVPAAPGSDAWAWTVWGREVAHLDLATGNGPSWKPLPVLFPAPLSLFGDAAPELWLAVARAGALLALVMAYRLAATLAGPPRPAATIAGALAVAALVLTDLVDYAAEGAVEPLVAALLLWAVERHLAGRHGAAFVLAFLASLGRPEAWPFLGLYAVVLWRRRRDLRTLVAALGLALVVLWFGAPWWGSGDPLGSGTRANRITEASLAAADFPAAAVVRRTAGLVAAPVLVAAAAAAALAVRRRAAPVVALAAAAAAWVALVAALTQAGFTGNERYLFPAVAALCMLGGVGAGWITQLAGPRPAYVTAIAALVVAVSVPFAVPRASAVSGHRTENAERAAAGDRLADAVRAAGGRARVAACGHAGVTRHGFQGALAWALDLPLTRVARPFPPDDRLGLRLPGVVFSRAERRYSLFGPRRFLPRDVALRRLAAADGWEVVAVTAGRARPAC